MFGFARDTATFQAQGPQFSPFAASTVKPASLFGTSPAFTSSAPGSSHFGLFGQTAASVSQGPGSVQHSPVAPSEPTIQVEKSAVSLDLFAKSK